MHRPAAQSQFQSQLEVSLAHGTAAAGRVDRSVARGCFQSQLEVEFLRTAPRPRVVWTGP